MPCARSASQARRINQAARTSSEREASTSRRAEREMRDLGRDRIVGGEVDGIDRGGRHTSVSTSAEHASWDPSQLQPLPPRDRRFWGSTLSSMY